MIKNLLLTLLVITAIEYNLAWNGHENYPNKVSVWEGDRKVEVQDSWQKVGSVYSWKVYFEGNLVDTLRFWQE